jgi:hypothetical protein
MMGINLVIIYAGWKLLVNIIVMKRSRPPKRHAEVVV